MKAKNSIAISVVIPLYNKREHIVGTINSVLAQTYDDFEVVVVDDGSTDGSPNLVEQTFGDRVRLIRQLNGGVSAARNRGAKEARGRTLAFIDADDSWDPNFLAEIAKLQASFPECSAYGTSYQFVYEGNEFVDPKIRFKNPSSLPRILDDYFDVGSRGALPFMMSSFCIRRDTFLELGGFPVGIPMGEDQELFVKVAAKTKIAYSPDILSFYHLDADNRACHRIVPEEECRFSKLLKEEAKSVEDENLKADMLAYVGAHLLHIASLNVRMGRYAIAYKLLSDEACKRHRLRHAWWSAKCLLGKVMHSDDDLAHPSV